MRPEDPPGAPPRVEPPRLPWETPGGGLPGAAGPGGRPAAIVALAIALAASVVASGMLAVRLRDREDAIFSLRGRVSSLQAEVDSLRAGLRSGGSAIDGLTQAVARIRDLTFSKQVDPEVVTDARLRWKVAEQFRKDNPRAEVEASGRVLTALGMLGPSEDLYRILLGVNEEVVGGFYDTRTKRLVIEGDPSRLSPLDRFVLAHELTHALTDQHFDLGRLDTLNARHEDDRAAAFLALAEGDASLTSALYASEVLTPAERASLAGEIARAPRAAFDASPEFLQRTLLFPYQEGLAFAQALRDRGGFDLVDAAYKDPPLSSEQILHPGRYLASRDDPQTVKMADVAKAMGKGWRAGRAGEIGEFDLRLVLDQFLPRPDAEEGAAGWDGGRYLGVDSGWGTLVAVLTVWDSEAEARQAAEAFGRWLPLRFGNEGSPLAVGSGAGRGWQSPGGPARSCAPGRACSCLSARTPARSRGRGPRSTASRLPRRERSRWRARGRDRSERGGAGPAG
ncbi:MAG: hypothetical protein HY775_09105 [Acidobacteria bacterium]|nr:hypothetical protein [Acidobacteriota bacterium]